MKKKQSKLLKLDFSSKGILTILALISCHSISNAFPPAPHHTFEGMLRDEYGRPIVTNADIIFETANQDIIRAEAGEIFEPGINYKINVPMDAGVTPDLYQPYAMKVDMPYKIRIKIGLKTYLPIELLGEFRSIGQPGKTTTMDLTLGEDSDGDGMPDAWERALLGNGRTLADINPDDDSDGDGLSNLDEYISGNYAFDKDDGLRLDIIESDINGVKLEFLAITGRTYTIEQSNNLKRWKQINFTIQGTPEETNSSFLAEEVTKLNVIIPASVDNPTNAKFFKLMVK